MLKGEVAQKLVDAVHHYSAEYKPACLCIAFRQYAFEPCKSAQTLWALFHTFCRKRFWYFLVSQWRWSGPSQNLEAEAPQHELCDHSSLSECEKVNVLLSLQHSWHIPASVHSQKVLPRAYSSSRCYGRRITLQRHRRLEMHSLLQTV